MEVENNAVLTCSVCRVEGPHRLLYLSRHLRASECTNCGAARTYSGHIYAEYARDLTGRISRLPYRLARETVSSPTAVVLWPARALRKPFGIAKEMGQVAAFEWKGRRSRA